MIGGVREYFDRDYRKLKYILDTVESVYRSYGYIPLETSIFESLDVLTKKGGEEIREQIFHFQRLGLRFDHTVPLMRFVSENRDLPRPVKRYSIGKVYRNEDPQRMRYIEFIQADVDVVGSESINSTLEVIEIASEALRRLGISYRIKMNDRRFLNGVVEELDESTRLNFFRIVDKMDRFGREWVENELERNRIPTRPFRILLDADLETVKSYSDAAYRTLSNIDGVFSPTLVRGLDYYTGEIFEIVSEGLSLSIGGGGRYSMFDEPNNVGISIGISRIYDLVDYRESERSVFIAWIGDSYGYAREIARLLRDSGRVVELNTESRSLRKQLEYASKRYRVCIIVGNKEQTQRKVVLRDMVRSEQIELGLDDLLQNQSKYLDDNNR
ncbi:MAG: histidine--tRNA ligase [Candidatus Micrarchaeota archaeon]|nr:histidine--tRNA ligase [Candidatus Micrarchaeota archaeon]MCX8154350.1 histidine--tRNA ligase [Candidatus Micrarchaeota archaeon]